MKNLLHFGRLHIKQNQMSDRYDHIMDTETGCDLHPLARKQDFNWLWTENGLMIHTH